MNTASFNVVADRLRKQFESGATKSYATRMDALIRFKKAIRSNEREILKALETDLGKPELEAYASEVGLVYSEINHALKNLNQWMKPKRKRTPLLFFYSQSWIEMEPRGVVLIIGAWNYPCQLIWEPLVGAIAAGCCAVVKPSELAPASAAIVEKVLAEAFDENIVYTVQGNGSEVIPAMMDAFRFDHVFYTGGTEVGRKIAAMAAPKLVPVTLELGGKSPCFVDESADLTVAAKRIVWGKFWNAGQTCVAPDYVLVDAKIENRFIEKLRRTILHEFDASLEKNHDLAKIVNQRHFDRLVRLLEGTTIVCGGTSDASERRIAPTLVKLDNVEHPLMQEEIFGPILPVLGYRNLNDALDVVRRNPTPLSLYIFTEDSRYEKMITDALPFGNGCVNNTVAQFAQQHLPFGGIGQSGYGSAHGEYSFEIFSHKRAMMRTSTQIDMPVKYRPYKKGLKWFRWLMKP